MCIRAEPGRDGVGAFGRDQCPIELEQLGSDAAVLVAEQFSQPLLHGAASAAVCSQMTSGLAASWAGAPESGLVSRAFSAEGFIKGAAPHLADLAAGDASGPSLLASVTPRETGRDGDGARCGAAADRALGDLPRSATPAAWAVLGADVDRSTTVAFDADFLVDRVDDQAGRTQRSTVFVAGGGLANRSQRAHGWARDLAVQLRHNHFPPIGRCR